VKKNEDIVVGRAMSEIGLPGGIPQGRRSGSLGKMRATFPAVHCGSSRYSQGNAIRTRRGSSVTDHCPDRGGRLKCPVPRASSRTLHGLLCPDSRGVPMTMYPQRILDHSVHSIARVVLKERVPESLHLVPRAEHRRRVLGQDLG
jgi:hypothetical protein